MENQGQAAAIRDEQPQSPQEKIEGKKPGDQTVPGAENPESKEVKQESNPNTE
jgi:hypothetical protein